jgi:predicted ATPase
MQPYWLTLLADVYGHVGQAEHGLSVLAEALAMVHATGQHVYEAELHRLRGELLLQSGAEKLAAGALPPDARLQRLSAEAEACFQHALDVSRRQQAKMLELRAALRLSRLWQQQGKQAEARELLAPVYGWFTEGFDTADLQEVKALLEELRG